MLHINLRSELMVKTSNHNLIGNSGHLISTNKLNTNNIPYAGLTKQRFDPTKYQLPY